MSFNDEVNVCKFKIKLPLITSKSFVTISMATSEKDVLALFLPNNIIPLLQEMPI